MRQWLRILEAAKSAGWRPRKPAVSSSADPTALGPGALTSEGRRRSAPQPFFPAFSGLGDAHQQ